MSVCGIVYGAFFDMVEGRVGLVGVQLTRDRSWVGWM